MLRGGAPMFVSDAWHLGGGGGGVRKEVSFVDALAHGHQVVGVQVRAGAFISLTCAHPKPIPNHRLNPCPKFYLLPLPGQAPRVVGVQVRAGSLHSTHPPKPIPNHCSNPCPKQSPDPKPWASAPCLVDALARRHQVVRVQGIPPVRALAPAVVHLALEEHHRQHLRRGGAGGGAAGGWGW